MEVIEVQENDVIFRFHQTVCELLARVCLDASTGGQIGDDADQLEAMSVAFEMAAMATDGVESKKILHKVRARLDTPAA